MFIKAKNIASNKEGETKRRSVTKALSWRVLASLDTFVISYFLTGNLKIAISIGGIEIFTKLIIYFFHERIWNSIKWGKRIEDDSIHIEVGDTKKRSVLKATTWRIIGTLDTITISYFLTGKIGIAITIGVIEIFTKMIIYFFHERIWNLIHWGKRKK